MTNIGCDSCDVINWSSVNQCTAKSKNFPCTNDLVFLEGKYPTIKNLGEDPKLLNHGFIHTTLHFLFFFVKLFFQAKCCGYGTNGQMTIGYDCVIIPIPTLKATAGQLIPGASDEFCGRALASKSNMGPATICCKYD